MILIAGLGNPGEEHRLTRHNIGFLVIDKFAEVLDRKKDYHKFNSSIIESSYNEKKLLLIKPLTFMNNSGNAVASVYNLFRDEIDSILVISDDIDIKLGEIRFKVNGGTGGHKGLESIVRCLGNADFDRLRFGVGRPPGRKDAADYVLEEFKRNEISEAEVSIQRAADAVKEYVVNGIEYCMNKYN